jgi:hypothetical protein
MLRAKVSVCISGLLLGVFDISICGVSRNSVVFAEQGKQAVEVVGAQKSCWWKTNRSVGGGGRNWLGKAKQASANVAAKCRGDVSER